MSEYSFKLPDLGEGIVESEISEWHVRVGDQVTEDQHIADVMTDKAVVEVTSPISGVVMKLACNAGQVLAVGSELILFQTTPIESVDQVTTQPKKPATMLASPSVRRRAREEHIDLTAVSGSGPAGRISNGDLENFISAGGQQVSPIPAAKTKTTVSTDIKIKGLRRIIAQKMTASSQTIPHYSYVEEIDVTALEEVRQQLNLQRKAEQTKLTLLPFIMQALTKVIPEYPHCNAHYNDKLETLSHFQAIHIGIATMTENGLMVPVIKNVEQLDIWQTAEKMTQLTQATRNGLAQSSELSGSTITITSLGAIGGIVTTPIINAPETSIVGINKVQERAVVKNGQIVIRKMMNLSSSFDHRIVDGYDGAQFIQAIKQLLENPITIFV